MIVWISITIEICLTGEHRRHTRGFRHIKTHSDIKSFLYDVVINIWWYTCSDNQITVLFPLLCDSMDLSESLKSPSSTLFCVHTILLAREYNIDLILFPGMKYKCIAMSELDASKNQTTSPNGLAVFNIPRPNAPETASNPFSFTSCKNTSWCSAKRSLFRLISRMRLCSLTQLGHSVSCSPKHLDNH